VEFLPPRLLQDDDNSESFSCGNESLDVWLKQFAYGDQQKGHARIFASFYQNEPKIAGYFALTCAHIPINDNKRGDIFNPPYILPCAYLARLAVDKDVQKQGLGAYLLVSAMERALRAAENIGLSLFIAEPLEAAERFYGKYDFEVKILNSGNKIFYRRLKDIRESLGAAEIFGKG